jgi:hypothetical protein
VVAGAESRQGFSGWKVQIVNNVGKSGKIGKRFNTVPPGANHQEITQN